ncbi:hypothetical protein D781_1875 [Serratia sp. FGI94]|uniref:hypothetical protein n=1 Tax=Serratia sp. FGI94 TaxID=671990 RepID=UPI0002A707E1|nr:hypothetical protein [Serratia sp. FGI94]AGB82162.1 hypothetical protein D781_1875 [Serratia sp. FGI94]
MKKITTNELLDTYVFTGEKPSRVKYEVYDNYSELTADVTVYRIDPVGIASRDIILLGTSREHPDLAFDEVNSHFEKKYA